MVQLTHMYCGLWGLPGCVMASTFDAIRLVGGTFALSCFAIWATAYLRGRG